jgi:hypothetical protein
MLVDEGAPIDALTRRRTRCRNSNDLGPAISGAETRFFNFPTFPVILVLYPRSHSQLGRVIHLTGSFYAHIPRPSLSIDSASPGTALKQAIDGTLGIWGEVAQ